jgi:putative two-component system response regulator
MRHGAGARIVVADDLAANVDLLTRLLAREGHRVFAASDGAAALDLVERERPDLVISDVMMPEVDGYELCRRIKQDPATRLTPVVLVTSLSEREDRLAGIEAGADDSLTKPVDALELRARVRSLLKLKAFTDDLDCADSVILSLGMTVEARDTYTNGHCERMAAYASTFGRHLGLPEEDVAALHRGGYLHDVGKIGIPDAILHKTGALTTEEYATMKTHTLIGDSLCGNLRLLRLVRAIVRGHHEHYDGSGYPDGIGGDAIPLTAQITAVADVFDALTTQRPYRHPMQQDAAFAELRREVERGWHQRSLVEEFITLAKTGAFTARPAS